MLFIPNDGYTTDSKGERHALSDYIDIESLARMYLLQEFSMNLDSGITSFYLYKDSDLTGDGKLHAAPVWDFVWHLEITPPEMAQTLLTRHSGGQKFPECTTTAVNIMSWHRLCSTKKCE